MPPLHHHNNHDELDGWRFGVLGEEGTIVDMTRFIHLPNSERMRLEADRHETGAKVSTGNLVNLFVRSL